ncbi:MAG: hypothetical protein IPP98_15730 [Gemmatimonadetes bacterium]|nr:hypothetical protein [Gemmatimonadota bacterium]
MAGVLVMTSVWRIGLLMGGVHVGGSAGLHSVMAVFLACVRHVSDPPVGRALRESSDVKQWKT